MNQNDAEHNKATFRRVIEEGFNRGNLEALDELFAPSFREHQNGFVPPTLEGVKGAIGGLRAVLPNLTLDIDECIAQQDKTWARITARGTHSSGKKVTVDVIDVCRFEDGKIVEHWGVADRLGLMQQLGGSPPSP